MWAWNGLCWASVQPRGDAPGEQAGGGLTTYDPDGKRVLLFGGMANDLRQIWSWAGGKWTRLGDSPAPPSIIGGAIAYDAARHQLVVAVMPPGFRGGIDDPRAFSMDTWLFDGGTTWRRADPVHKLPFRPESMVFDPSTRHVLASRLISKATEVWSWDGRDWSLTGEQIPTYRGILVDGGELGVLGVAAGDPLARPGEVRRVFRWQAGHWVAAGPLSVGPTTVFHPEYDQLRNELVAFGDVFAPDSSRQVFTQDTWTWTLAAGWTRHAGPTPTPSPSPTPLPTPTPCSSPSPPNSFAASAPSDRTLALVTLSGSDQIVVRDITDINHPATVATPGLVDRQQLTFVSATEIAAMNGTGVVRMPLSGSPQVQAVAICPGGAEAYGWSRDGQSLTYLAGIEDTTAQRSTLRLEWHLARGGSDRVVGTAPGWVLGVDYGGWDVYDYRVAFSPDGSYISLVLNFVGAADFQVRRIDGTLVSQIKSTGDYAVDPTMGVWSGSTLYFRDSKGVEAWRDGTVTPFLPGVAWIRPKVSPAGGQITYAVRGAGGLGHVYIVDTGTRKVIQLTKTTAVDPAFLSSRYIWYDGVQICNPPGSCAYTDIQLTGKTYIYDLQAGTETASRIAAVYDVWPHGT